MRYANGPEAGRPALTGIRVGLSLATANGSERLNGHSAVNGSQLTPLLTYHPLLGSTAVQR